jgi:hypothetical protein
MATYQSSAGFFLQSRYAGADLWRINLTINLEIGPEYRQLTGDLLENRKTVGAPSGREQ